MRLTGRFWLALSLGVLAAAVLFTVGVGPRSDFVSATHTLRFDLKFVETLALASTTALGRAGSDFQGALEPEFVFARDLPEKLTTHLDTDEQIDAYVVGAIEGAVTVNFHVRFLDVSGALLNELHGWRSSRIGAKTPIRRVLNQ